LDILFVCLNWLKFQEALCAIMEYPSRSEIFSDQSEMIVSIDAVYAYYFLGQGFIASMDNSEMWSDEVEREVCKIGSPYPLTSLLSLSHCYQELNSHTRPSHPSLGSDGKTLLSCSDKSC
jgi:hypothetical protein